MAEPAIEKEIKNFEENQQWWWAAEKRRSKRLDYLRKAVWRKGSTGGAPISPIKLDLEPADRRIKLYKQFKKEPQPLRTAKILAAMWETDQIYIVDHSQIVGSKTPSPSTEAWEGGGGQMNAAVYNYPEILPEPLEESLKKVHDVGQYWDAEGDAMDKLISMGGPGRHRQIPVRCHRLGQPHRRLFGQKL